MKKKKGFTVLELIIAVAIMSIIVTITVAIFGQNNRILSDVNIKSTLQTEAQNISKNISDSAMESSGIAKLILFDDTKINLGEVTEQKYSELNLVDSNGNKDITHPENNQWINVKEITINDKYEKEKSDGTKEINDAHCIIKYDKTKGNLLSITTIKFDNTKTEIDASTRNMSKNIESILIKPNNMSSTDASGNLINELGRKISDTTSIELNINLSKKKGLSDIKYSIPITVTFRNKEII